MKKPDFLDTSEYTEQQVLELMNLGVALKACVRAQYYPPLVKKQTVGLLLGGAKLPITTAFEAACAQLGGTSVRLDWSLEKPDSVKRVANLMSDNLDCAVVACERHETLLALAKYAEIPIVNAGSGYVSPLFEIASLITMFEHLPSEKKLEECKAVFEGKADVLCTSALLLCTKIGMQFYQLCTDKKDELQPPVLKLAERNVKKSGGTYAVTDSAAEAYRGADFLFSTAPIGTKLPAEASGVMRIDDADNILAAARSILTCMLYRNPASREPILVEKMKRTLAVKLQAIFGFGEANE